MAIQGVQELTEPLAEPVDALTRDEARLSRREREIANLIRAGKTSSEIAQLLVVSPTTIAFHRKNLRRKLGLGVRSPSLATHLAHPLLAHDDGSAKAEAPTRCEAISRDSTSTTSP